MQIISVYSHNQGIEVIPDRWHQQWAEVHEVIRAVDLSEMRTKISREKTMPGRRLYDPRALNRTFRERFGEFDWRKRRIQMTTQIDLSGVPPEVAELYRPTHRGFREIDFVKENLGIEVQFGKYAFMVYNVLAKMTIFHNRGVIDAGIEIVPMRRLSSEMSTGVSYFEQMKADLEARGIGDLDIPVIVLGIDG